MMRIVKFQGKTNRGYTAKVRAQWSEEFRVVTNLWPNPILHTVYSGGVSFFEFGYDKLSPLEILKCMETEIHMDSFIYKFIGFYTMDKFEYSEDGECICARYRRTDLF